MAKLKKVSTIKRGGAEPGTYRGSLAGYNLTRFPGTIHRFFPHQEIDGSYRTGLDPNAGYIKRMGSKEQEMEIERVTSLLEKAKSFFGDIDLSPRSDYYTKMTDHKMGGTDRCPITKLVDGDNIFDIDTPLGLIQFAYLRVHPDIAPSMESINSGNYTKAVYFINDDEVEDTSAFKKKVIINKAIGLLNTASNDKRKKIGRQIGLGFTDDSTEANVYNRLDDFIQASTKAKSGGNAELFIKYYEMADDNLAIRDMVKQALMYGALRKNRTGEVLRGKSVIGNDEEAAVVYYSNVDHDDELTALQEELKIKKTQKQ